MKTKKLMFVLLILLTLGIFVNALDECDSEVKSGDTCVVTSPKISCSTYDLYNTTNQLKLDDSTMAQIGDTGIYYFNFSQSVLGKYTLVLCSNDTGAISVVSATKHTKLDSSLLGIGSNSTNVKLNISDEHDLTISTLSSGINSVGLGVQTNASDIKNNVTQFTTRFSSLDTSLSSNFTEIQSDFDRLYANFSIIKTDLNSVLLGMRTNTTWLSANISSSGISLTAAQVWNYNITTYNVSGDFHSAGAYLRALEVYRYG